MDWLYLLALTLAVLCIIQLVRLALSDCDLTLQWVEKFGRKPACLAGKVVWITGASSGIGEHLAYKMAAAGCRLILSARREDELQRVKKECVECGKVKTEDILVLPLDMVKFDSHQQAMETVLKYFKKVDILVNNAGRSQRALWVDTSVDVDREMLELNVLGTLSLTKAVLPHMLERQEGHIVVMSSIAGKVGAPMSGSYTGSKHALQGWFEALRIEAFEEKIAVTMVCPGPVFSNLLNVAFTGETGKMFGESMQSNEKRMSTARCAELTAVAIANRLDEAWISIQPVLLFTYMAQYMPTLTRKIATRIGMKRLRKVREGQQ